MERNYKLYVHITPNGKKYYGITGQKYVKQRWQCGKGYNHNQYFTKAINKYGWNNIQHIVLHEGLGKEEAEELEQYMIQWYDTTNKDYGYNISLGGETGHGLYGENHPMYGKHHSEEARQKISESNKGKCHTEEAKKKISEAKKGEKNPNYGKKFSNEHKQKMSENNARFWKGKHHSEETKKKISEASKGKPYSEDARKKKSKPVICVTTKKLFYGLNEAERQYHVSCANITRCCQGKAKSAGKLPTGEKLVWRYIDIIEL